MKTSRPGQGREVNPALPPLLTYLRPLYGYNGTTAAAFTARIQGGFKTCPDWFAPSTSSLN